MITYLVDCEVNGVVLPAIEVASDTVNADLVLGCDIVNHLLLLIDGPSLSTELLARLPRGFGRVR